MLETIDRLTCTNSNFIHLHFNVELSDGPDGHVFDRRLAPSDERLVHVVGLLKTRGFAVNLKPGFWYGQIGWSMMTFYPADVDAWFANWTSELIHYATVLDDVDLDYIDVSYEHTRLTHLHSVQWSALIDAVRAASPVGISANFQNAREAQFATLLRELDLVQLSVFYRHTDRDDPTVAELRDSWTDRATVPGLNLPADAPYSGLSAGQSIVDEIVRVREAAGGLPVMIGDIAFVSTDGAASSYNTPNEARLDYQEQCDQYQGFFEAFVGNPDLGAWFRGVTFLTWFPFDWRTRPNEPDEVGPAGRTLAHKPVERPIVEWFSGQTPAPYDCRAGTSLF